MAGTVKQNPDPAMLENLDLLLNLEVLQNEKDWNLMGRSGMLKHLLPPEKQSLPAAPAPPKEQTDEK